MDLVDFLYFLGMTGTLVLPPLTGGVNSLTGELVFDWRHTGDDLESGILSSASWVYLVPRFYHL